MQNAAQRPTAKELQEHRFVATSMRAAAQAALQPLISRAHDHLSALAVRFAVLSALPAPRAVTGHPLHGN